MSMNPMSVKQLVDSHRADLHRLARPGRWQIGWPGQAPPSRDPADSTGKTGR